MNLHFIKSNEKRKIIDQLGKQFGVEDFPHLLIESGKEKIRAFSGSLSKDEIAKLSQIANIELIGLYFIKREDYYRLSLDAIHLLKSQINKNIADISEEQFNKWIRGNDLELNLPAGIYIVRYKEDFIGCGKSNGAILFNYVPKDRRLRK